MKVWRIHCEHADYPTRHVFATEVAAKMYLDEYHLDTKQHYEGFKVVATHLVTEASAVDTATLDWELIAAHY